MNPVAAAGFLGIQHFSPPWDIFYLPLFNLLIGLYELPIVDFALAIILFTIVIRTILAPLFVRQIRSQKEMQRMQPLLKEVQRKHKGNRTKIQEETAALYKEHGVNPAGGCLPTLLQLPILWALYQALIRASNTVQISVSQAKSPDFATLDKALGGLTELSRNATNVTYQAPLNGPCDLSQFNGAFTHFLPLNCQLIDPVKLHAQIPTEVAWLVNPFTGIHLNLALPDNAFALIIPGIGFGLSALAVVAAILQFVQVKMTAPPSNPDDPTSSATSTMTYLFPLLTIFWGGLFASGLILYWVVYTAYLVIQQYAIMGWGNLFPIFGWSPGFARRNESLSDRAARRELRGGSRPGAPPPTTQPSNGHGPSRQSPQEAQPSGARQAEQREREMERSGGAQRSGDPHRPRGQKKRGRKR